MLRKIMAHVGALFFFVFAVPSITNAACFSVFLQPGDVSPEVSRVQEFLKSELGLEFETTQNYGPLTRQAVYSFQNKYTSEILAPLGLTEPTGVWGSSTMEKANALCTESTQSEPFTTEAPVSVPVTFTGEGIAFGQTSDQIRILQELLNREVAANLPLTGYFGPMTQEALRQFQLKYSSEILAPLGLVNPTGIFGTATLSKIRQILSVDSGSAQTDTDEALVKTSAPVVRRPDGARHTDDDEEEEEAPVAPPVNTADPVVSGDTDEGDILTTTDGTWTGESLAFSYQWLRDDAPISGATSSDYEIMYADPGTDLSVVVTATNSGGSASATSSEVSIPLAEIDSIAFFGDSITSQSTSGTGSGGVGTYQLSGVGYSTWAKAFNQSKWDFEPNGSSLTFATGGKTTDELMALHLADVVASNADVVVDLSGTNDVDRAGYNVNTLVANRVEIWSQIREAGKKPIAMEIPPFALSQGGNATGTKSLRVVESNAALADAAEEMGVPWVTYDGLLETTPGTGIADTSKFGDALHPNGYGANIMGRALGEILEDNFQMPLDNWTNTNYLTQNVALTGSSGQPTTWVTPSAPSGGTINSKSLVSSSEGNWWTFDVTAGTSTSSFAINNFSSNIGGSPVGKIVESIAEIEVISGTFKNIRIDTNVFGASGTHGMLTGYSFAPVLTSSDGVIVLRTQPHTVASGATLVSPTVYFNGDGVIRFRRVATRQVE